MSKQKWKWRDAHNKIHAREAGLFEQMATRMEIFDTRLNLLRNMVVSGGNVPESIGATMAGVTLSTDDDDLGEPSGTARPATAVITMPGREPFTIAKVSEFYIRHGYAHLVDAQGDLLAVIGSGHFTSIVFEYPEELPFE